MTLTDRQQQIFDFVVAYKTAHDYAPTIREIGTAVGLSSLASVHRQLEKLEWAGRLERVPGSPRALRVLEVTP